MRVGESIVWGICDHRSASHMKQTGDSARRFIERSCTKSTMGSRIWKISCKASGRRGHVRKVYTHKPFPLPPTKSIPH